MNGSDSRISLNMLNFQFVCTNHDANRTVYSKLWINFVQSCLDKTYLQTTRKSPTILSLLLSVLSLINSKHSLSTLYRTYFSLSLTQSKHLTFLSSCPPFSLSAVTLAASQQKKERAAIAIAMAKLSLLFPLLLLVLSLSSPSLALHSDLPLSAYGLSVSSNSRCSGGSLGECSQDEVDDPTTRRFLAGNSGYISYAALRRDSVPCSMRGASYYNCRPGAQANPYRRGCSAITRCRG